MNITEKIIITDTNIITDLDNAKLLSKFVLLENIYISDLVKNDEMNFKTGDFSLINKFKTIELVNACNLLINSKTTRIPKEEIENLKNKYEKDLVLN